jgi:hypothetical protein
MALKKLGAAVLLVSSVMFAFAHSPKVGANGGAQTDAGSFHVEVVPQGTNLQVFLRDHADKAVPTDGFKGIAIFIVEGKPQRIPLSPTGENRLSGTTTVAIPSDPKGVVQITTPAGSTVQARFN